MENKYLYSYNLKHAEKLASDYDKKGYTIVGIEAEWGDCDISDVFPKAVSLSHHGKFNKNPPPCTRWDLHGLYKENTCFVFSHFDLDSLLGLMILEGEIDETPDMYSLTEHVGWVDVMGQHRAHEDVENYNKWVYFIIKLSKELSRIKKDYKNTYDIIVNFKKAFKQLLDDYYNNPQKILDIKEKHERYAYNALDKNLSIKNKLHIYMDCKNFLSKYYIEYKDYISLSEINIQYDPLKERVSIGVRDEETAKKYFGEKGVIGILQEYFGDESGGRLTVGGSPKNKKINFTNFIKFVKDIKRKITDGGEKEVS